MELYLTNNGKATRDTMQVKKKPISVSNNIRGSDKLRRRYNIYRNGTNVNNHRRKVNDDIFRRPTIRKG